MYLAIQMHGQPSFTGGKSLRELLALTVLVYTHYYSTELAICLRENIDRTISLDSTKTLHQV